VVIIGAVSDQDQLAVRNCIKSLNLLASTRPQADLGYSFGELEQQILSVSCGSSQSAHPHKAQDGADSLNNIVTDP